MNERIRELIKQAGGKTTNHTLASNPVQYRETHELWDNHIEKFAELVAGECAVALAKVPGGIDSSIWYSNLQKFNKHLGIKP